MKLHDSVALALTDASCMKKPPPTEILPLGTMKMLRPFLKKASDEEVRERAVAMAREHVQAKTPHVAWCGMVALYRPSIPAEMADMVKGMPILELPSGCVDPLAMKGALFGLAYNSELVRHLPLARVP